MSITPIRLTGIVIPLDDFTRDQLVNVNNYAFKMTDLFAARMGVYIRLDAETRKVTSNYSFDSLKTIRETLDYDLVCFLSDSHDVPSPDVTAGTPSIEGWWSPQYHMSFGRIMKWMDFLSFWNPDHDIALAYQRYGQLNVLSHEIAHEILTGRMRQPFHSANYHFDQFIVAYDRHYDIVTNPSMNPVGKTVKLFAEQLPPDPQAFP